MDKYFFFPSISNIFITIFKNFGHNPNFFVKFIKFLVKYHKDFVQISKIFWNFFSKRSYFSNILVMISMVLIKIWSNFWKDFDQNLKNYVRNQYKNVKDFGYNQTFCNTSPLFWSKISKMLVKVSQILVDMWIRAKISNIISSKFGSKSRAFYGQTVNELSKMWVNISSIIKYSFKNFLRKLIKILNFVKN